MGGSWGTGTWTMFGGGWGGGGGAPKSNGETLGSGDHGGGQGQQHVPLTAAAMAVRASLSLLHA